MECTTPYNEPVTAVPCTKCDRIKNYKTLPVSCGSGYQTLKCSPHCYKPHPMGSVTGHLNCLSHQTSTKTSPQMWKPTKHQQNGLYPNLYKHLAPGQLITDSSMARALDSRSQEHGFMSSYAESQPWKWPLYIIPSSYCSHKPQIQRLH